AEAAYVSVIVVRDGDRVLFSVEDDGVGFDQESAAMKGLTEKGLGLATMSERMRMIGGELEIWSRTGEGTRITFSIPVAAERATA
ncbi:MAG TPA: ATP-binding protein, partial [Verrucomicrobiae bacterium]|nr:ATP-binding protein [Verrucomicrobiae bacterium]